MNDCPAGCQVEHEPGALFGGFFGGAADGGGEGAEDEEFVAIVFLMPVFREGKRIEAPGGADHDGLGAAEEDAEAFFFNGSVKAADHGEIGAAPRLGEIHRFDDSRSGAGGGAEERVEREVEDVRVAVRPERFALPRDLSRISQNHRSLLLAIPAATQPHPVFDVVVDDEIEFLLGEPVVFGEDGVDSVDDGLAGL